MKKTTWPGNWKVTCHVCGFWYPSSEIQKRWDGVLVCPKDYETRHPQTLIKVRGERAFPSFVSKDSNPDQYTTASYCDYITSSGVADYAVADCARADGTFNIDLMIDLFNTTSIAGIAIAGLTIPGVIDYHVE
jgi:hypothetical protein